MRQQRHAVRGEQGHQLVVGHVPAAGLVGQDRPDEFAAGLLVHVGQLGHLADRPPPPAGVLADLRQRDDRALGRGVGRDRAPGRHAVGVEDRRAPAGCPRWTGSWPRSAWPSPGDLPQRRPELLRAGHERREEDGDDGVHPVVVHRLLQGRAEVLGVPSAPMSTGSSRASSRPLVEDGVGDQPADGRGVADDRHPLAGRQRLVGQERADVEHLRHGLHPDDPGGGEQRRHRLLGHRDRRVDQAAPDLHVPAALHGDHRLGPADAACQPGELAGVAEALQVQEDDLGAGSVAQYWSRSLPLTSARLPADTKVDNPRLRLRARSSSATPSDPDWAKKPTRPRAGIIGARLALSRTSGRC